MSDDLTALVLAALNLANLTMTTWNNRKLRKVEQEQKDVAANLHANGQPGTNGNRDQRRKPQ